MNARVLGLAIVVALLASQRRALALAVALPVVPP